MSDPDGQTTVATTYDSDGRISTVSNPHRSTSSPTDGTETYIYDGLDRKTQVTHADGNVVHTYYGSLVSANGGLAAQKCSGYGVGYPILSKDEAGNLLQSWRDGFGRLIEVDEPSSSGSLSSGAGTCYSYDLNNNLTGVAQGSLTRTFSYDMLSRLTMATNPESGTINYYYTTTTSGTTPCSGDPGAMCLRVAPKANQAIPSVTVTTTYTYDALNRLTQRTYSDGTPTVSLYYDTKPSWYGQGNLNNLLGRLTQKVSYSSAAGQTDAVYGYDPVGHITVNWQQTPATYPNGIFIYYNYNLDGSISSIAYPSGRTVTYTTGNAQRTTTAYDSANNYALGPSSCPFGQSNGMNWACYAPPGELDALKNGASLTTSMFYNNRLQPCRTAVTSGSTTVPAACTDTHYGDKFDIQYSFDLSTVNTPCATSFGAATDNGNVASITNNVTSMSGRSQQFCYDALNRISSARTTSVYSTGPSYCWGETYGIDPLGNLSSISQMTPAYNSCLQESGFSTTINSHNQDALSCYDAAGNKVGVPGGTPPSCSTLPSTYSYDAENRLISMAGVTYTYDGDGNRVEKSSGTLYWYGPQDEILAETSLAGSDLNEYVFFGGKRIARVNSSGSVYYYFADQLGTSRVIVQDGSTPTLCYDADFYSYGGERPPYTNTCSQNYKFTGKERDSESGLDNFGARYDSSQYGRFMSPDPSGLFYASPMNPQSLNLYSYVGNNPLSFTDPTGLDCVYLDDDQKSGSVLRGDCASDKDNGIFVNGTVDTTKGAALYDNGAMSFAYVPEGGTAQDQQTYYGDRPDPGLPNSPDQIPMGAMSMQQPNTQSGGLGNAPPTDQQKLAALKVAGMEASHDLGCAGYGWATEGASVAAAAPIIPKPFSAGGTSGTSLVSTLSGGAKIGTSVPTPVGIPFTESFAWRASNDVGRIAGRYAPYVGTAIASYQFSKCVDKGAGGH